MPENSRLYSCALKLFSANDLGKTQTGRPGRPVAYSQQYLDAPLALMFPKSSVVGTETRPIETQPTRNLPFENLVVSSEYGILWAANGPGKTAKRRYFGRSCWGFSSREPVVAKPEIQTENRVS